MEEAAFRKAVETVKHRVRAASLARTLAEAHALPVGITEIVRLSIETYLKEENEEEAKDSRPGGN